MLNHLLNSHQVLKVTKRRILDAKVWLVSGDAGHWSADDLFGALALGLGGLPAWIS